MWDLMAELTLGEFVLGAAIGFTVVGILIYYDIV